MKRKEKLEDIQNRFTLVIAERDACCVKGSENYEVLTDVAKMINGEYTRLKKGDRHIRHGFRLDTISGKYRMVVLSNCERV